MHSHNHNSSPMIRLEDKALLATALLSQPEKQVAPDVGGRTLESLLNSKHRSGVSRDAVLPWSTEHRQRQSFGCSKRLPAQHHFWERGYKRWSAQVCEPHWPM